MILEIHLSVMERKIGTGEEDMTMTVMQLTYDAKRHVLSVTAEEALRLVEAAKAGEALVYECEDGRLSLEGGVLTVSGFATVPMIFAVMEREYYGRMRENPQSDEAESLKALVREVVVEEGARYLMCSFIAFKALRCVRLPDSVEIMENTFAFCDALEPYTLPASLKRIYGLVFAKSTREVTLPDGLEYMGGDSFAPAYVRYYPFENLAIRSVTLPKGLTELEPVFRRCGTLERVVFPEGLERICSEAFSRCESLNNVVLPDSLTEIGDYAFSNCTSLDTVTLPKGDCWISETAFHGCPFDKTMQVIRMAQREPIPYAENMGEIPDLAEMARVLGGKPLAEQFAHFALSSSASVSSYAYGQEEGTSAFTRAEPFPSSDVSELIVRDGILVGAVVEGCQVIVGNTVCTYSASEDDGAGSRSREDYCTLLFSVEGR